VLVLFFISWRPFRVLACCLAMEGWYESNSSTPYHTPSHTPYPIVDQAHGVEKIGQLLFVSRLLGLLRRCASAM
jgi:hypothetical protein